MGMETIARMIMLNNASLPGLNDFTQGAQGVQQMMNGQLEYAQARDNYEAMKGLRALFAQNPNPDIGQIGALSPAFAQEVMKNQYAMQKDFAGIQRDMASTRHTNMQTEAEKRKIFSQVGAGIAEQYINRPMDESTLHEFRGKLGAALDQIKRQYGFDPDEGFDINQVTPESVLRNSMPYVDSPTMQSRNRVQERIATESAISGMPPRPSPEQTFGHGSRDPITGQPVYTPPVVGQPPASAWSHGKTAPRGRGGHIMPRPGALPQNFNGPVPPDFQQQPMTMQDVEAIRQHAESMPPGPEKAQAMALYDQARQQLPNDADDSISEEPDERTPPGYATPEQNRALREQSKEQDVQRQTQAEQERERNKLNEQRHADRQRAMDAYALVPTVDEIEKLIKGSTSGALESKAASIYGSVTGSATPGMEKIGALEAIAGKLQEAVTRAPGDPSTKEVLLQYAKTGDIANPEKPWNQRLSGYRHFVSEMRKMIEKAVGDTPSEGAQGGGEHTPRAQALIDQHKAGQLSDAEFKQAWDAMPEEDY